MDVHCMTFYYYIVTGSSFKLRLYARNDNRTDATLWSRGSSQGKMGRVSMRSAKFKDEFNVVWELRRLGSRFEMFEQDTVRLLDPKIRKPSASLRTFPTPTMYLHSTM